MSEIKPLYRGSIDMSTVFETPPRDVVVLRAEDYDKLVAKEPAPEAKPFSGPHWDKAEIGKDGSLYPLGKCVCDLRDRLLELEKVVHEK